MASCQPSIVHQFSRVMTHSESSYSRKCAGAYINIVLKNLDYYLSFLRCGLCCTIYRQTHSRSSRPVSSFAAARFPPEIGLVLYRLANHLEQPWRSKCATRSKLILQFRNQSIPKKNRPLKIPFLAHEGFRMQLQQFLHQEVRRAQPVLIPYHLPTTRPLEAPPTKVIKLLWSDVKALSAPTSACS